MDDDFMRGLMVLIVVAVILTIGYNGLIKDHPIERYYISSQVMTECGERIRISASQPWNVDLVVYKAKSFEEAVDKVNRLNSTLVKE